MRQDSRRISMLLPQTEQEISVLRVLETVLRTIGFPKLIVELGTGTGTFTKLLALVTDAEIHTYDDGSRLKSLGFEGFRNIIAFEGDIFKSPILVEDCDWLICDNGNKRKEVETFAPRLRPGSLLWVHDVENTYGWNVECPMDGVTGFKKIWSDLWFVGIKERF